VKRRFVLTPEASADLREILLDIAEESPEAAERLRVGFLKSFEALAQTPGMGHYHEELMDQRYRFKNLFSYVICYVWEQRPIRILAVVHGARDLAVFFGSRPGVQSANAPAGSSMIV
jgi:plasmid stabilization system protein ParE